MPEYLDIVDLHGEPVGEIIERSAAHAKGIRHRTSHVWLVRIHGGKIQLLLQKRSAEKDSYPGCYDISSAGHIPAGAGFADSAIRELREELGVTASEKDLIFCGDRTSATDDVFHGREFHDRQVSRVYMLFRDTDEADFRIQESELESVLWMDLDRCVSGVEHGTFKNCIAPEELALLKRAIRTEFETETALLEKEGLRNSPLRLAYEERVRQLADRKRVLFAEGCSEEETARILHAERRQLGYEYKKAAPPLFGLYILYATEKKYGDPLGPDYDALRKRKTPAQIIDSASRPIRDLHDRLSIEGFAAWFAEIAADTL